MPTFPSTKTAQLSQFELRFVWQRRIGSEEAKERESDGGGVNGEKRGRERLSNKQGKEGVKRRRGKKRSAQVTL